MWRSVGVSSGMSCQCAIPEMAFEGIGDPPRVTSSPSSSEAELGSELVVGVALTLNSPAVVFHVSVLYSQVHHLQPKASRPPYACS